MAGLRWHPRFGDRAQELVILSHRPDPDRLVARLRGALRTDAELAAGPAAWQRLDDPSAPGHADPGEGMGARGATPARPARPRRTGARTG